MDSLMQEKVQVVLSIKGRDRTIKTDQRMHAYLHPHVHDLASGSLVFILFLFF
jgi:hypothetical protein